MRTLRWFKQNLVLLRSIFGELSKLGWTKYETYDSDYDSNCVTVIITYNCDRLTRQILVFYEDIIFNTLMK